MQGRESNEKTNLLADTAGAEERLQWQQKLEQLSSELAQAQRELADHYHNEERCAAELLRANEHVALENAEKEARNRELEAAYAALEFQNRQSEQRASELARANRELALQNSEKERRSLELNQAMAELDAFAYVSSHDLQEPLRKIQIWVDQLGMDKEQHFNEKGRYLLGRIVSAAQRMRQLIRDLYEFSRINAVERRFETADLRQLAEDVCAELHDLITEKGARLEIQVSCSADMVVAQFRQLLRNLLHNALKFADPGRAPEIRISADACPGSSIGHPLAEPETEYCHLCVQDNGIGFDPHYGERIFKVFQRLHSVEEFPGTGIGLAIVKKVAESHNGIVLARSDPGRGSAFTVYFPRIHVPVRKMVHSRRHFNETWHGFPTL
ncbi:sensor histidine kinase [Flaviaesturariibacter terrae]